MTDKARLYSALIPPTDYGDLNAMMTGVQTGSVVAEHTLNELRDLIGSTMKVIPSTTIWNQKRNDFLLKVSPTIQLSRAEALLPNLRLIDLQFARYTDLSLSYKLKLNVELRNETGIQIMVQKPSWTDQAGGLPQKDDWSGIQLKSENGSWGGHTNEAVLKNGQEFRAVIAFDPDILDSEFRRRHENLEIGVMNIPFNINGHSVLLKKRI